MQTISRRAPKSDDAKLQAVLEADTAQWTSKFAALVPAPTTVISSVGTTRVQAGSLENQRKIDQGLNIELAKAAKEAGVKTFIFVSSHGVQRPIAGSFPYFQMKENVEQAIRELEFEQAVILRPTMILGDREVAHTGGRVMNFFIRSLGSVLGYGVQDSFGQEADVIAKAALHAAKIANEGMAPSKFWVLGKDDVARLGRTEWTD